MSSKENFISQVCDAFKKAVESASGVTLEGREREFRRVLARRLFDETLGWEGRSKIGEIYDITCFDDENFPIIVIETKWGVKPTSEIKEKLRKRIEELGSVKYGVFASERDFIAYEYVDYKLKEITKINVAEATGVARGEYELSEKGKKRVLKLEVLKRERFVWIEDPEYFEKTYKEISVAKAEGVELLTENLKDTVSHLTTVLMNFFDSYWKRKDHYSGKFLRTTFFDWLRLSMRDEGFRNGNETERRKLVGVFCRETAYVLLGKILFTRICEDKDVTKLTISGKGLAESLQYYERRRKKPYLLIFDEAREEIKKYYTHLYELGYFDWWWISPEKIGVLGYDDKRAQDTLEDELNENIKRMFRRFNRFDFTQVDRDILGDVYQGYLPPNERKRLGEFYTPKEVIEYILDAVGYEPEKEIRGKKILDPACGSGSFLVEAVQRLIERYRRVGLNLKDPDDAKQVIERCISSIYGLDIHPFACFIAEMNLLFQLVDLYDIVRQKDRYYRLPRLNIFITDSLMPSGEIIIELMEFVDNSRRKMLLEETKGANKVKTIKFDYVVENPPYVHQKGKKGKPKISFQYRERLRKHYKSLYTRGRRTRGGIKVNLFAPFIERSVKFLEENSKFGFIVHKNILKVESYKLLREYILETCQIEQIVDLGAEIFEDVTGETCIMVLREETDENKRKNNDIKVITGINDRTDLLNRNFKTHHIKQESFYTTLDNIFPIYISEKLFSLKGKIAKNKVKLSNAVRIVSFGLNTIDNKRYVSDRKINENYKKALMGRDIGKYLIKNKNRYVFYDPKVLSRIGDEEAFLAPEKIIMQRIGAGLIATYDDEQYYCFNSLNIILAKDKDFYLKYVLGVLNSTLMDWYYRVSYSNLSSLTVNVTQGYLQQLPIPHPRIDGQNKIVDMMIQNVDQILQLNEQNGSIKQKIKSFPNSYVEDDWSFDKLMNTAKSQSLSRSSYGISEKSLRTDYRQRDLDGSETFRIILDTNEFVDFYSEEFASYVFEVLKTMKRITKRELLELKIPQKPHLKNLLNQYRKDKEQIVKNEKAVKELEKQIDDLVYKLYDITYKERRIIEEYLAKF